MDGLPSQPNKTTPRPHIKRPRTPENAVTTGWSARSGDWTADRFQGSLRTPGAATQRPQALGRPNFNHGIPSRARTCTRCTFGLNPRISNLSLQEHLKKAGFPEEAATALAIRHYPSQQSSGLLITSTVQSRLTSSKLGGKQTEQSGQHRFAGHKAPQTNPLGIPPVTMSSSH
jgi:hypothetical protein